MVLAFGGAYEEVESDPSGQLPHVTWLSIKEGGIGGDVYRDCISWPLSGQWTCFAFSQLKSMIWWNKEHLPSKPVTILTWLNIYS